MCLRNILAHKQSRVEDGSKSMGDSSSRQSFTKTTCELCCCCAILILCLAVLCRSAGISVASAAKTADPGNPNKQVPATQAQLIPPYDVNVGSGIIHNIDGLLLPMTNITRLIQLTGCKM